MPALTPDALRTAVARLTPSRVPAFVEDLVEATTNAQQTQSLAPLRTFVHTWGVFVAIQRRPTLAARLRHLEEVVSAGTEDPTDAIAEIWKIHADAEAEAGLRATGSGSTTRAWSTSRQGCP
ncbi:DUF6247 family protein [Streptomyces sp. NPDC003781]|uniref:DUF6247 family protein n=1 Tax=Streptomyces sp. NPDC003781 TaxID=3364686 RepID=UPI0036C66B5F